MEWRRRMMHGIDPPTFDARARPPLPTEVFVFEWKQDQARGREIETVQGVKNEREIVDRDIDILIHRGERES